MGIGNTLRGDDATGPKIIDQIYERLVNSDIDSDNVYLLNAATAPENHTIEIRQINPSHLIIIDAVEFDDKAGSFIIVDKKQVDTFGFSTHTMPISFLINYLEDSVGCEILTMGIQPKDMTLVDTISPEVMESIDELVELIIKNI
ncbi:MAG: hydrogenase maturation peptidase HycI [Methanosphaera sp. SHI613]|jgi:hydrogenase 3 maturation protease|nr:MAG: hydrogenase maturation peptidase HycI [Methanosphaera sp. SHI613]